MLLINKQNVLDIILLLRHWLICYQHSITTTISAASSNTDMNANLSKELVNDQEINIKLQHLEQIEEEEEKVETVSTKTKW